MEHATGPRRSPRSEPIHSDQVFAIFGGLCSTAVKAATTEVIEAKVPWILLSPAAQNILEPVSPYLFAARPSSFDQTEVIVRASKQQGFKRIALLTSSDDYGLQARRGVEHAAKNLGPDLVAVEVHNLGDTDFIPQLLKVKQANPDAILITSYLKEIAILLRQSGSNRHRPLHCLGHECHREIGAGRGPERNDRSDDPQGH